MSPAMPAAPLLLVLCAVTGIAAGWTTNGWRLGAELADLRREHAQAAREAAEAAHRRLARATAHGHDLSARLATAEAARDTALEETRHAIRRVTTGRPCLDAAAVRLLNHHAGAVHETAGEPDGADAAVATDTDVALWAAHARRSYDTCRGRLAAIDAFYAGERGDGE